MNENGWNRCDYCGKYIPFKDFDKGLALRTMANPDTAFTIESYNTLCKNCNQPPNQKDQ